MIIHTQRGILNVNQNGGGYGYVNKAGGRFLYCVCSNSCRCTRYCFSANDGLGNTDRAINQVAMRCYLFSVYQARGFIRKSKVSRVSRHGRAVRVKRIQHCMCGE